jgi:hypothetical protein
MIGHLRHASVKHAVASADVVDTIVLDPFHRFVAAVVASIRPGCNRVPVVHVSVFTTMDF